MTIQDGVAFAEAWFPFFVDHARERGHELAEMMTDCAREELLNSHAARHMRSFGRRRHPHFWARCEWEDVDISFGQAKGKFPVTPSAWNDEWDRGNTGDLGIIEAKLVYQHLPHGKALIERMTQQLRQTAAKVPERGVGAMLGMVWWLSYAGEPPDRVLPLLTGYTPLAGGFQLVGHADTGDIWPITNGGRARLDVGLFRLNGQQ